MNDTSLTDSTPPADPVVTAGGVFGSPTPTPEHVHPPVNHRHWTIEEILESAKLPERHARICLRADLEAEHQQILAELKGLVNAQGEVLDDPERSAGEESPVARAQQLADRLTTVERQMRAAMWFPLFRGLSQDALQEFNAKHWPKKGDADGQVDLTDYNVLLIAECSIDPVLTVDQVRALRGKLGSKAYKNLTETAHAVCVQGGVDVPKSSTSLLNLARS